MTQEGDYEATPPWDAARVNLTSRELAPGVFAVMPDDVLKKDHVATTAGFVIGERLFEWAHNSVNVPAAYQHLRALRGGKA